MAFPDRIIPAVVHDDGSVHHSSVMSHESDTSCAVCYMVPMRIIPVIFVPGIMGSNLKSIDSPFERPQPIWTVNSKWSIGTQWGGTGAANRKKLLDPQNTEVTWGNVTWKRTRRRSYGGAPIPEPTLSNPLSANAIWNPGLGQQVVPTDSGTALDGALFVLQDADERGDGTVPTRSGKAPSGRRGVQVCVPYPGVEHEGAYKDKQVQRFALWAITKIAYRVKQTSMAYKT
jgi:hypothetical protein